LRRLVYYVASTLDGFIAHEDGSFGGFAWDDELVAEFRGSLDSFGAVLMGRKTYEVGLREGKTSPYPQMEQYLFSRSMAASPDEAVRLVSDDAVGRVSRLKREGGKDIWLCGGSGLAGTLLAASLIDEVRVKLNPVLFGSGIPLVPAAVGTIPLRWFDTRAFPSGILVLRYEVGRRVTGEAT
jgi:dihydrofolate reductase